MSQGSKSGPTKSTGGFGVGSGGSESTATYTEVISSAGMLTLGTSKVALVSAAPAATTLTAAQSGSIVAISATGANVVTLPTAAVGLQYRLVVSASGAAATITPGSGDKIIIMDSTGASILTATAVAGLSVTMATPNAGAGMILTAISTSEWVSHAAVGVWAAT